MIIVTDTQFVYDNLRGKKVYSGQNREGIDRFVSERIMPNQVKGGYGARWAAVGRINSTKVEVGFEEAFSYMFRGMVFEVENACVKK